VNWEGLLELLEDLELNDIVKKLKKSLECIKNGSS